MQAQLRVHPATKHRVQARHLFVFPTPLQIKGECTVTPGPSFFPPRWSFKPREVQTGPGGKQFGAGEGEVAPPRFRQQG